MAEEDELIQHEKEWPESEQPGHLRECEYMFAACQWGLEWLKGAFCGAAAGALVRRSV